jgi:hypothetical protein
MSSFSQASKKILFTGVDKALAEIKLLETQADKLHPIPPSRRQITTIMPQLLQESALFEKLPKVGYIFYADYY